MSSTPSEETFMKSGIEELRIEDNEKTDDLKMVIGESFVNESEKIPEENVITEKEPEKIPEENVTTEKEPESKREHEKIEGMLDLAFSVDNTGSMQPYINAVQQHIRGIIEQIVSSEQVHVRFALVMYRDHKPQDQTFVTRVHDFTSSIHTIQEHVGEMKAAGGGDGPESVADSFYEILKLSWREKATKICIHISDAPPHGLEPSGDGFPNGCPCGHDPLELARQMLQKGITVYTVGCDGISSFRFAKDFMISVAEITQGQAIALSSASMLANVILGGAREEICLEKLTREVEQEMQRLQQEGVCEEIIVEKVTRNLQSRGIQSKQMKLNGKIESNIAKQINTCANLAEVRSKFHTANNSLLPHQSAPVGRKKSSRLFSPLLTLNRKPSDKSETLERSMISPPVPDITSSESFSSPVGSSLTEEVVSPPVADEWKSSTECNVEEDLISYEQVRRVMNRTCKEVKYSKR